jgi:AcrR family transcriptional regulator
MPRPPRNSNAKPRRDEILDQATRLFAERGYEGTSMGDLAERCGMRKASLFYHFDSKDALYAAVLDRLLAAVQRAIVLAAGAEGSFVERLDAMSDAMTTVLAEQPFAARLIIREAMDWGPVIQGKLESGVLQVLGVAEQFLLAGQEAGAFAANDAKQLLVSLIGLHFMPFGIGAIVQRFAGMEPFDASFVLARREAVRTQVRAMVVARAKRAKT